GDQASINVKLDGEPYLSWQGPQSALTRAREIGHFLNNDDALGLGTYRATVLFHSARVRMLSGEAKLLRPASATGTKTNPLSVGTKPGHEWDGNGLKMKFCWCPPGKFTMGSPKEEPERQPNEDQVEVVLSRGFWLGKYEVTREEWRQVMDSSPSFSFPVPEE